MEFLSAIATAIVGKIAEYTFGPVVRQISYVTSCKRNLQQLEAVVKTLKAARDSVANKVGEAERRGEIIQPYVQQWLEKVDEITAKTDQFFQEERPAELKCFHGGCSGNMKIRHQMSRKSTKLLPDVVELLAAKQGISEVACGILWQEVRRISTWDYQAFPSRTSTVKEIMDELKNPNSKRIGVYGIGGVGKTTLLKQVYRQATEDEKKLFDDVVIVLDVKENPDLEGIQKKIVEKLGMKNSESENETRDGRASRLCARIKGQNTLVILDDVWEEIKLEAVGIPSVGNCKILLTSRSRKTLSDMSTDKDFALDTLEDEETWVLFENKAGDVVKDPAIRTVAIQVAKYCRGLPLLVVTIASTLKKRTTLPPWKDALRRLEESNSQELTEKAYLGLEWSYSQLNRKELQQFFLLCGIAIRGNKIILIDLLRYGMGLGFLGKLSTLEEAQNKVVSLVEELKDFCLLMEGDNSEYVKMPNLVRDVANRFAFRDHHMFSLGVDGGGRELKEWWDKDFLEKCTIISLRCGNNISRLPKVLQCQALKMLLLQGDPDDYSMTTLPTFFQEMKQLNVLALEKMCIPSLPSSFQSLKNVQTLCLERCDLGGITLVGELSNLEILSFAYSNFELLPKEIAQLTHLRLLDLTDCSGLRVISPGVISSLTRLEDLRMNSFDKWEAEGESNASLLELKHLPRLAALEIQIPDAKKFPANLLSCKLERYQICIGRADRRDDTTHNTLKIAETIQWDKGLKALLKKSEDFHLAGTFKVGNTSHQFHTEDFQQVNHIVLQNDFTYIINRKVVLPNLTRLVVHRLDGLSFLLSSSIASSVVQFKHLEKHECQIMEEIVSATEYGELLELNDCPSLSKLFDGYNEFPSFLTSNIVECIKLEAVFDPASKSIAIYKEIEDAHSQDNLDSVVYFFLFHEKVVLRNIKRLIIHRCHGLRILLSSDVERSLVQLKHVEISDCQIMKEIVLLEECSEVIIHDMFPKLEQLVLNDLPNLTRFCSGSYIEFPSLERLQLEKCIKLETFISYPLRKSIPIDKEIEERDTEENLETVVPYILFDKKVGFPKLERLTINDLPKLTKIWGGGSQLSENSFCKLRDVTVQQCNSLINILPHSIIAGVFQQLQKLKVENCGVLEEIVYQEEGETSMPDLPKVTCLEFKSLPQLKRFHPRTHFKWPLLKTLELFDCRIVDIFDSGFSSLPKTPDSGGLRNPVKQRVVLIEKNSFPKLENLTLGPMDIWYGPPAPAAFDKLAVFRGISSRHTDLKTLRLHGMEKLMRLWEENTEPAGPVFLQLKTLEVKFCGLNNIELSAISFKNLTNLEVTFCWRLQYLTTYPVAQSLVHLKKLKVDECKSMKAILANDGDGEDESNCEIVFKQLQHLELSDLISLEWFCSRNCTVKVPLLETSALVVNWCSLKLKISSDKTLEEVDSNMRLNVQKTSNSRKEEPPLNASESEQGAT